MLGTPAMKRASEMDLEAAIQAALTERTDISALACLDETAGLVLGLCAQPQLARDAAELALLTGCEPHKGDPAIDPTALTSCWCTLYARVPQHPELVVLGLARSGANAAGLRAWLQEVAHRVGHAA